MIKKELEVFYGVYKENNLKAVDDSYNSETKTIKVKIENYIVEYEGIETLGRMIDKKNELEEMIKPRGECGEIHLYTLSAEKNYTVYKYESSKKRTEVTIDGRKHFLGVPVEMIDEFMELEKGKFKIYAEANDYSREHPALIKLHC